MADYNVIVTNSYAGAGTDGTGLYSEGSIVTIVAGDRDDGYNFNNWQTEGIILATPEARTTAFIMPTNDVTVTAQWQQGIPDDDIRYVYPPTTIYVYELDRHYDAQPADYDPEIYIVNKIPLPSNATGEDIVYKFEVYVNDDPTGIIGFVTVYKTSIRYEFMEPDQIIVEPDKLGNIGGNVFVTIKFRIP